jgi:cell division septum initiation protein DivIVA
METPRTDSAMWSALPEALPAPKFKTAKRGFDQNQVVEYVGQLNTRLRSIEHQVRQLRHENEQVKRERDTALRERAALVQQDEATAPSPDADGYQQVSDRVTELFVALDDEVEKIRAETAAEAEAILDRARSEAYRVSREAEDARTSATLASHRTREEAKRTVADLEARRDAVLQELQQTCTHSLDVIGNLAASLGRKGDAEHGNGSASDADTSEPAGEGDAARTVVLPDVAPDTP